MSDSFATPWTVACQTHLSMGFPRQEHWSGLSFPLPGDLPNPGIKSRFPALAGRFFTTESPGKPNHTSSLSFRTHTTSANTGGGQLSLHKSFQLTNEAGMIELGCHQFATSNKLANPGAANQQLLTQQRWQDAVPYTGGIQSPQPNVLVQ